jgi:hypothetical protein
MLRVLFILLSPVLLAITLAGCSPEVNKMTPEESQHIEQLTTHMTPRCVGRYLINLPDSFVLNSVSHTEIEGVTITVKSMQEDLFEHVLTKREAELRSMHMDGEPNKPFLKRIENTPSIELGKVFNRAEATGSAGIGRVLELWGWRKGYRLVLEIKATDYPGAGFHEPDDPPDDTPKKLAQLLNVYERLRGRADTEIPKEPGVCFANGFVSGPPTDAEWIDMNHHLSTARDVYSRFISMSHIGPEENTLLQRGPDIETALKQAHGLTLRKGEREANGLKFEEWLSQRESETYPGLTIYFLTMEMNSAYGDAAKPLVTFDLSSGVEKPGPQLSLEETATQKPIIAATLSAAESIALWDKVTATLRPRPGAF